MDSRPYPQDVQAERALLGGLISDDRKFADIAAIVTAADFYQPTHGALFRLLEDRIRQALPVDMVALSAAMMGDHDRYGGMSYVVQLPDYVPSTANLDHYAEIVAERATLRRFLTLSNDWQHQAFSLEDSGDLVARAGRDLQGLQRPDRNTAISFGDAMRLQMAENQVLAEAGTPLAMSTGFRDLDEMAGGGLFDDDLIVLAARPAMGKTALAMNVLLRVGRWCQRGNREAPALKPRAVAMFSMEMSRRKLLDRWTAASTGIALNVVKNPHSWRQEEWNQIVDMQDELADLPILIDTRAALSADQMRAQLRLWSLVYDIRLIVVDYLGLMPFRIGNRAESTGQSCAEIKSLAKEHGCAAILLHQLNRGVEKRDPPIPQMSDLKDSGDIEQHADAIWLLYRPHYYDQSLAEKRLAWLLLPKQRQAEGGVKVALEWWGEVQLFRDPPTLEERRRAADERRALTSGGGSLSPQGGKHHGHEPDSVGAEQPRRGHGDPSDPEAGRGQGVLGLGDPGGPGRA